MGHFRVPKNPQAQAKCKTFLVIMNYIQMRITKSFVHINSFTRSLALKQRLAATRKWPNIMCTLCRQIPLQKDMQPNQKCTEMGMAEKSYTYILTSFTSVERSFFVHTFMQHILQMVGKVRQTFVGWKQYLTFSMQVRWVVNMYTALNIQCIIVNSLGFFFFNNYKVYFKEGYSIIAKILFS